MSKPIKLQKRGTFIAFLGEHSFQNGVDEARDGTLIIANNIVQSKFKIQQYKMLH